VEGEKSIRTSLPGKLTFGYVGILGADSFRDDLFHFFVQHQSVSQGRADRRRIAFDLQLLFYLLVD
jgi:hypothetical protein